MSEHGIDEIDPARRDEIRRRIAVVEEFMRAPGSRAAEAAAERLGIRTSSFYALVKAWSATRDPTLLPGGRSWSGGFRRTTALPGDLEAIAARIAADMPDAATEHVVDRIADAARAAGVETPTRNALRIHVGRLRAGRPRDADVAGADYVVDHCLINIPVATPGGTAARPLAALVLDVAQAAAVGIALTIDVPDARTTARALVDAADAVAAVGRRPTLLMDRAASDEWRALAAAVVEAGIDLAGVELGPQGFGGDAGPLRARGNGRAALSILGRRSLGTTIAARNRHLGAPVPPLAGDVRPTADIAAIETMLRARMRSLRPVPRIAPTPAAAAMADLIRTTT